MSLTPLWFFSLTYYWRIYWIDIESNKEKKKINRCPISVFSSWFFFLCNESDYSSRDWASYMYQLFNQLCNTSMTIKGLWYFANKTCAVYIWWKCKWLCAWLVFTYSPLWCIQFKSCWQEGCIETGFSLSLMKKWGFKWIVNYFKYSRWITLLSSMCRWFKLTHF